MAEFDDEDDEKQPETGISQAELLKSYLAFAAVAIRQRLKLSLGLAFVVIAVTAAAATWWPRTYHAETRLLMQGNPVFDERSRPDGLRSAAQVISRRENLEDIIKRSNAVKSWSATRPPLLRFKDSMMEKLRGKPSDAAVAELLVRTLEQRLGVGVSDDGITVGVDWSDPVTAARLAEIALDTFIQSRRTAEISSIAEKITIWEQHSVGLRAEIQGVAQQLSQVRAERRGEVTKAATDAKTAKDEAAARAAGVAVPVRVFDAKPAAPKPPDLSQQRADLQDRKRELTELKSDQARRMGEAQGKLVELRSRYTDSHPEVRALQSVIDTLSKEPPRVAQLNLQIASLEGQLKAGSDVPGAPVRTGGGRMATAGNGADPRADVLPAEVMRLLDDDEGVDPVASTQLSASVSRYAALRNEIRTASIDLDTAEAAFKFRYKVSAPAEVPSAPIKPKVPLILGAGLAVALLLALIVPILLQLKNGMIIEVWQVQQMQLPVLAQLHLPAPRSDSQR